jgi:predicted ArsR family transcriptional regulator
MADSPIYNEQTLRQALKAVHGMYIQQQIGILNALQETFGPQVEAVIKQKSSRDACAMYQSLAQQMENNTIDDLINVLWEPLHSKGYEFTVERTGEGVQIHCTVCPFSSMYRGLGGPEWGYALYCAADEDLTHAFNSEIGFHRAHTLMEGHTYCDHLYFNIDQATR